MTLHATVSPLTLAQQQSALQAQIRSDSANADLRAELFQLLALQGDWARARAQLELCLTLNPNAESLVRTYLGALRAEERRTAVFSGAAVPEMIDPSMAMEQLARALACDAAGDPATAAELRADALAAMPAQRGLLVHHGVDAAMQLNSFEWVADADNRLGPVLEVIIGERYLWMPLTAITRIRVAPARSQCDLVWAQASLRLKSGRELAVMIPVRYCLAGLDAAQVTEASLLVRETLWAPLSEPLGEHYRGIGQRMWATDHGEHALLEIAEITLEPAEQQRQASEPAGAQYA